MQVWFLKSLGFRINLHVWGWSGSRWPSLLVSHLLRKNRLGSWQPSWQQRAAGRSGSFQTCMLNIWGGIFCREQLDPSLQQLYLAVVARRFTPLSQAEYTDTKWVPLCLLWHLGGVQIASLFHTLFHSSAIQKHTIPIITPAGSLIKINGCCWLLTMSQMMDRFLACHTPPVLFINAKYQHVQPEHVYLN